MKALLGLALTVVMMGCSVAAETKQEEGTPELKTQQEKFSYAIGLDVGSNLKSMKVDINIDALVRGLNHGLKGEKALLTREQVLEVFRTAQEAQTAAARKEGDDFLAENKKKEGVITTKSGLQYKVIKEGKGQSPKPTDQVRVHYKGTLIDGTEFDSSYKRGRPATFEVGQLIPGWSEALQLMKEGGTYQLFIPSDLAYGAQGAGETIGPHAALIFEVRLVKIEKPVENNKLPVFPDE
jgi:FKBP-type peptidyl-prolyl cis-trans isomerase FklB